MIKVRRKSVIALLAMSCVLIATALPATAASRQFEDPARDVGGRNPDLVAARVSNNENRVFVRVDMRDLREGTVSGPAGIAVWIDTNGGRYPERVFSHGLALEGTDYQMFRTKRWRSRGFPLNCDTRAQLSDRGNSMKFSTGRDCLGSYGRLRVAVEITSGGRTDYGPRRHKFYPSVSRA